MTNGASILLVQTITVLSNQRVITARHLDLYMTIENYIMSFIMKEQNTESFPCNISLPSIRTPPLFSTSPWPILGGPYDSSFRLCNFKRFDSPLLDSGPSKESGYTEEYSTYCKSPSSLQLFFMLPPSDRPLIVSPILNPSQNLQENHNGYQGSSGYSSSSQSPTPTTLKLSLTKKSNNTAVNKKSRRRENNRIAAERYRNRKCHLISTLSERCEKLCAEKESLLLENELLINALETAGLPLPISLLQSYRL